MSYRLPSPWGTRINRNAPLNFIFEGRTYAALEGDTIASALAANGQRILSRSFKYHRPRGILTMAGQDANTLVQLEGEPNVRADLCSVMPGMVVTAQNVIGSLSRDFGAVMGIFRRFMPAGFYYRTFFGASSASWLKLWEPLIRRFAGLGRISFDPPAADYRKRSLHCDVLVVGAGPAGLSAALEAAATGCGVVVVEQGPEIGGSLTYARFDPEGLRAASTLDSLRQMVERCPNIQVLVGATCNGFYADNWLPVIQGDLLYKVRAAELVLATGSQEQPLVFRNNDLPGVMLSSAAQRLMRHYGVRPGRVAVVFAGGLDGYRVALDLDDAGIKVAAVIEPKVISGQEEYRSALEARGIRVMAETRILEAHGRRGIHAITIGQAQGSAQRIGCDLLVIAAGFMPAYQLALQAGATLSHDERTGHFHLANLPERVHLAGSLAGTFDLEAVVRSGERAGAQAAAALGGDVAVPAAIAGLSAENFQMETQPHPKGFDFVDFDEDLQTGDIWNAIDDGYREIELVKRFSTVGMGPSQGRHSALATARIVAAATGRSVAEVGVTTARPPFGPEKLGLLAGPARHPFRHSALHQDLLDAGAQMMPVGAWWRPAYFGTPETMGEAIAAEVAAVREGVAMLDVSTLGKMAVRGPDAGQFLDRFYTMLHSNQALGKVRYCLMLNEMGCVIDDGVAYRLAEDHYHVSTTTGTAARVYAEMSWWNAQWQLDVDIQNVTSAFAGINLTGPLARKVLEALPGNLDFSQEAFGYLDGRSGVLADCSVLAMRIGFTGELSYELHVPYSEARRLWAALLHAGESYGIRPYGLEASRILRLEKGHIIIGQDTDAMTSPDELSMEWALSKRKTFYIGRTAVMHRRQFPMTRKLCAFEFDGKTNDLGEGCLVFRQGRPVGFVSSFAYSPILRRSIGLAYAHPEDAEAGRMIEIRTFEGRELTVPVVTAPFYDPDNERQTI